MADHHRFGRYAYDLAYRWVGDIRGNREESRSVGTLVPARALQRADRGVERAPACLRSLRNAEARRSASGADGNVLEVGRVVHRLCGGDVRLCETTSVY